MRRFLLFSGLFLLLALGLALTGFAALRQSPPSLPVPPVSGHGALMANLDLAGLDGDEIEARIGAVAGDSITYIRLRLPWNEIQPEPEIWQWTTADRAMNRAGVEGLQVVLVLDGAPAWAVAPADQDNPLAPPQDPRAFGRFAAQVAARYGDAVAAFQIWDEPNIAPHWGARLASPRAYLQLLKEAANSIHRFAPAAPIMLAALAPTTAHDGANLSDLDYLDQLYRLDAAEFFDIVAGAGYGFEAPPEQPPAPDRLNYRRPELLRQIMQAHGDAHKPLWITAWGWWAAGETGAGQTSPWGEVSPDDLLAYQARGLQLARRQWPWAGPMAWVEYALNPNDPAIRAGWAQRREDGSLTTAGAGLLAVMDPEPLLGSGSHAPDAPAIRYQQGAWRLSPAAADPNHSGAEFEVVFAGRAVALRVQRGQYWGLFKVWIDGEPAPLLPRNADGESYLVLFDPENSVETAPLARRLQPGLHQLRVQTEGGWGQWPLRGIVVDHRPWPKPWPFTPLAALLSLALLAVTAGWVGAARSPEGQALLGTMVRGWDGMSARFQRLALPWQFALALAAAALFYFAPGPWLSLLALLPLLILLALRMGLSLFLVLVSLPFYVRPKYLGPVGFSLHEFLIWLVIAMWTLRVLALWLSSSPPPQPSSVARRARAWRWNPDYALLALLVVALFATLNADRFGFAVYDFRTVLLTPALFYWLLTRLQAPHRLSLPALSDALVLGAVLASAIALGQFLSGTVAFAEGVPRVSALYGSANNLALYLGRVLPLLIAVSVLAASPRRWLYRLALISVAVAAFLTFSKGLLLISLPAGLLLLAWLAPRLRRVVMLLFALAVLALLPFLNTPRFMGLLNTNSGTTFLRLQLWQSAWRMWLDHPWLGVGPDNFLYDYRSVYVLPTAWEEIQLSHPHNLFLDLLTRLGLLGFLAGMWLLAVTLIQGLRLTRNLAPARAEASPQPLWPYYLGLFVGLCAGLLHGLIDNSIFLVDLSILTLLVVGVTRQLTLSWNG